MYDLRDVWDDDVRLLQKTGRAILEELATEKEIDADALKRRFEAIRVHNTTIRTDIAIVKLTVQQQKMKVKPKKRKAA